jgi:hypothetical protein
MLLALSSRNAFNLFIYVPTVSACFYLGRVFLICGLVSTNFRLDVSEKYCQVATHTACDFVKFSP